jgi:AAA15 family ATPase/GTPase
MKIKNIALKNFKRFTDLAILDIPVNSKLVLMIGSNGSGKSSLFDAFDWLGKGVYKPNVYDLNDYYKKDISKEIIISIDFQDGKTISKIENNLQGDTELVKQFLGRSSIRIVPKITNTASIQSIILDTDSPFSYIENDTRFINDVHLFIQQINIALREPVFSGKQADTLQIFRDLIEPLNNSLIKIFGGDETNTIQIASFEDATVNAPAKLIFKKGTSKINYDLLSHGEKQVVILLINFIVRQEYYKNAIIFIDEMDCHLNTALQCNLIEEIITKWIPDSSQLWTASHALGFIHYARKNETASIIDFDLLNFDTKQELVVLPKDNIDVYEIAIPKSTIASILKG